MGSGVRVGFVQYFCQSHAWTLQASDSLLLSHELFLNFRCHCTGCSGLTILQKRLPTHFHPIKKKIQIGHRVEPRAVFISFSINESQWYPLSVRKYKIQTCQAFAAPPDPICVTLRPRNGFRRSVSSKSVPRTHEYLVVKSKLFTYGGFVALRHLKPLVKSFLKSFFSGALQ